MPREAEMAAGMEMRQCREIFESSGLYDKSLIDDRKSLAR